MKKTKFFILINFCLLLSSCVSFSNENLSEGLNFIASSEDELGEINYYDGDSLPSNTHQVLKYDFVSCEAEGKYISSLEELTPMIDNYDSSILSLNSSMYVSQGTNGLKIGISSSKTYGKLDVTLNTNFKYVKIIACPRISYVFDYSLNKTVVNIDKDTSIKVNEKDFVRINNIVEEDISSGNYLSTIIFKVKETSTLKLFEYNNRAIIQSITLYSEN